MSFIVVVFLFVFGVLFWYFCFGIFVWPILDDTVAYGKHTASLCYPCVTLASPLYPYGSLRYTILSHTWLKEMSDKMGKWVAKYGTIYGNNIASNLYPYCIHSVSYCMPTVSIRYLYVYILYHMVSIRIHTVSFVSI